MKNIMKKIASRYAVPVALAASLYFLSGNAYAQSLPITEQTKITLKQNQDESERITNEFVSKASGDAKNKFNQYLVDGMLTVKEREDIYNSIKPLTEGHSKKTSQEIDNLYTAIQKSLQSKKGAEELEAILKKEGANVKVHPPLDGLMLAIYFSLGASALVNIAYKALKRKGK